MKTADIIIVVLFFSVVGCDRLQKDNSQVDILINGSSTVYLIAKTTVQSYLQNEANVNVSLEYSGTSNGIHKLCTGSIDIANASRQISPEEIQVCEKNDIAFHELLIAKDGIAIVVHANNIWVDYLTVIELQKIWDANSEGIIATWSDIRDGWPDRKFKLYGPGSASGTYGYFAEAIVGEHATRGDYVASEDDEILAEGVSENPDGLGFFGMGYYQANNTSLKLVPIEGGDSANTVGPTIPSSETIRNGDYQPLSRNMYIYVAERSLQKQTVAEFIDFFLQQATQFVSKAGYIPQSEIVYTESRNSLRIYLSENN